MRISIVLAFGVALAAAGSAAAQSTAPAAIESWSLEKMSHMGEAIAAQDIAAIAAGERLRRSYGDADPPGLVGWVAVASGETQRIRFIAERDGELRAGWDIVVTRGRAGPVVIPEDTRLSADELAQHTAKRTAAANVGAERCGRYNAFALREPDGDDWLVWLLANANDLRTIPVDGHYRFRITADGLALIRRDRLSTHCAQHERVPNMVQMTLMSAGGTPPSEALVYVSIMHGFPIAVENSPTTFVLIDGADVSEVTPRTNRRRTTR
jgi:hypothetical protein